MSIAAEAASDIRPFHVEVSDEALEDLPSTHRRDAVAQPELVGDRSQGVQLATMQALARYWATERDWRASRRS